MGHIQFTNYRHIVKYIQLLPHWNLLSHKVLIYGDIFLIYLQQLREILSIKKLCIKSCDSLYPGDLERIKGKEKKEEIKQVLPSTVIGI